jgi:lipopolysaccharide biosynthesis glycosyltransferase
MLHLAMASDERYAMPMAVAVRSLLEKLSPNQTVSLSIVDDGVRDESKRRCESSWEGFPIQTHWLRPLTQQLQGLPVTANLPLSTYYRLTLAELLPNVKKVLYIDPDVLVMKSILPLWQTELGQHPVAASQDLACPFIHFRSYLPNYKIARRYLLREDPIPNFRELNLPAAAPYFNAGIMLLNLEQWRREDLGKRLITFIMEHAAHNVSADQYGLNACLWNRWLEIDTRWNQLQAIHGFPGWQETAFTEQKYREVLHDPWILHFAGPNKPWESQSRHPRKKNFFECLDRTAWRGWRPTESNVSFGRKIRRLWRVGRDWTSARCRRLYHQSSASARAIRIDALR